MWNAVASLHEHFLFFAKTAPVCRNRRIRYLPQMSFTSLTHEPLTLTATEQRLTAVYEAARKGLKGDTLAYAAGMKPSDYRRLQQMDPLVEMAELKGHADGEMELATVLHTAATAYGDTKAALDLLKHTRGWVAKQQMDVTVDERISVIKALEMANQRVIEGVYHDTTAEAGDAPTSTGSLTTRLTESHDDCAADNT